jgi:hypothetical protein
MKTWRIRDIGMSERTSGSFPLRQSLLAYAAIIVVTLGVSEIILRLVKPEILSVPLDEKNLSYRHDPELGWLPIPNSTTKFTATRTITVHHNGRALRDASDYVDDPRKPIVFVGDSFVWGYDSEENERFTDVLQRDLPTEHIVNAGVSGYGTDQEYLLLRRYWDQIKPRIVVLVVCTNNDRLDNSSNKRYGYYKPYYATDPGGKGQFKGIPAPVSKNHFFAYNWFTRAARYSMLTRLAVSSYYFFAHPEIHVPDPTEDLIVLMKQFVESHGAKFLVGIQYLENRDPAFEAFLQRHGIPFASFEGADHYPWTPEGHALVAKRMLALFTETAVLSSSTKDESTGLPSKEPIP